MIKATGIIIGTWYFGCVTPGSRTAQFGNKTGKPARDENREGFGDVTALLRQWDVYV